MRVVDPTYGSDANGLVWGYCFRPGQEVLPISSEAATELLATGGLGAENGFLWLHVSLSNSATEPWLRRSLRLPESFYESLYSQVGSTLVEQDGGALVALIHDVLFEFTFDPAAVATASLLIEPRLLLSARLRPLRSIDQLRAAVRSGRSFRSPVELLAHLLRAQAGVLVEILRKSTARVDEIEDRFLAKRKSASRAELGSLRRVLVRLQRLLAPEPAALFRLLNEPPDWVAPEDLPRLQQAAEELAAAVSDAVVLVERVKLIQEELAAFVNEQTSRTLFVLTVVTVLALPINLVAGLFGMNVGGIPLASADRGFFWIVAALASLTALLAYLALGRRQD